MLDRRTGEVTVFAQEVGPEGNVLREYDDTPDGFGRIAATTARQVILQRLRDAEHEITYGEYAGREGDVVAGVVQQAGPPRPGETARGVRVDLGKVEAVLPASEQVPGEIYEHGLRLKCYVLAVHKGLRGPQITLSRSHPNLVRKLFALEVPEIADGSVEIAAIAREAGHRTKIAVRSTVAGLGAKGACIGPLGSRVRARHGGAARREDRHRRLVRRPGDLRRQRAVAGPREQRSRSSTPRPGRRGWSCPTTSSRSRSARRARTPGWPPGSPAGASTSAPTPGGGPNRPGRTAGGAAPACRTRLHRSRRASRTG